MKVHDIVKVIVLTLIAFSLYSYVDAIQPRPQLSVKAQSEFMEPDKPLTKYEVGPPDAQEMLELVNIERAKVGVKPLKRNANVEKAAQLKADDFVARDYYSHKLPGTDDTLSPEMAEYIYRDCSVGGENIAADQFNSQQMINVWMASPPHRKAILDAKYQSTGFGVSKDKDSDYYSVQKFCVAK